MTRLGQLSAARAKAALPPRRAPTANYGTALLGSGQPKIIVDVVVDADVKSAMGELDSGSRDLSTLLGRSTTHFSDAIKAALQV